MEISPINNLQHVNTLKNSNNNVSQGTKFDDLLKGAISDVNKRQVDGYEAMRGIATGEVANLQEAIQKIAKADSSLKLGLEVKNKALGAYKEIMKMQI